LPKSNKKRFNVIKSLAKKGWFDVIILKTNREPSIVANFWLISAAEEHMALL
jgi:hypothetical protein